MSKDYKKMNLYQLVIELEAVNNRLDRIKNDPEYIRKEVIAFSRTDRAGIIPKR